MKNIVLVPFLLSVVGGCATVPTVPLALRDEASLYLRGQCLDIFLDTRLGGYQHIVQNTFLGRAVFALAIDADKYACGMAAEGVDEVKYSNLVSKSTEAFEALAIERCEKYRISSGMTSPCRVFARKNEIVWRKVMDAGLQ